LTRRDLSGIVQAGRGIGAALTADTEIIQRLRELAGCPIVPGTLNVRLPRPIQRGRGWWYMAATEITDDWEERTGQAGYYLASVVIADRYKGLAFQAEEPGGLGYPPDQIELFCEVHLRQTLGIGDGDPIAVVLADV
jgi:CTP-dependent riboflavin kinase